MKRQKNSTEDTLGDVKARGEWLMASSPVVKSSLQSNGREKRGQMERESEKTRERNEGEEKKESDRGRKGAQKLIVHGVTFEEESEVQVE